MSNNVLKRADFITIVVAPTGAGKNFLYENIKESGFKNATSVTTREPREGEVLGVDYYFITEEEFKALDNNGKLIESVNFGGNQYGLKESTIVDIIRECNKPYIIVEPDGMYEIIDWCVDHQKKDINNLKINIIFLDIDRETRYNNILNDLLEKNISMEEAIEKTEKRINRGGDSIKADMEAKLLNFSDFDDRAKEDQITILRIKSKEEMNVLVEKMKHYDFNQVVEFIQEFKAGQTYLQFDIE